MYQDSANDIANHILGQSQNNMVENQGNNILDYIIDLEEVPNFLQQKIA